MGVDPADFSVAADAFGQTNRTLSNVDAILHAAKS